MAEELISQAQAYKEEGNKWYGEGSYKRALGAYHKVFLYVNGLQAPTDRSISDTTDGAKAFSNASMIPKDRTEDVKKLKQSTRLNMAACYLKLEEHQKCVDACSQALELGSSSKAHFRRGQAYAGLRNFGGARADLERARELAPDDPAIVAELRRVRTAFSQGDERERKRCARMFGTGPADPREQADEGPRVEEALDEECDAGGAAAAAPDDAAMAVDAGAGDEGAGAADQRPTESVDVPTPTPATVVQPVTTEVLDEARRLDIAVRELTYAWQQSEEDIKIYISFDQSDELKDGVDESRVQVEYGEWSFLLVIQNAEGRTPLGLRLGDFHRRVAPEKCRCTVRSSRITLKLVKQVKEHWWNLLQHAPLHSG